MRSSGPKSVIFTWAPDLPRPLQIFVTVAFSSLALALTCEGVCCYLLHAGWPYRSPLLNQHFADLVNLWPRFVHFHTLPFFTDSVDAPFMYPAPVAIGYRLFYYAQPHALRALLCFVLLCFSVSTGFFTRALIREHLTPRTAVVFAAFCLLTSYPLWFELAQANQEIVSWIWIMLGIWSFVRGHTYRAAVFLGIAGSMKITPFFYLALFFPRRQYRQIALALAVAIAVTIPSLWWEYPHIATSWHLTQAAIAKFPVLETLQWHAESGFDHSLFALIKRFAFAHLRITEYYLAVLLAVYSPVSALSFLVLYVWRIRKLPLINQILCLCIATLLLPPTSFDYTLMTLYAPWALLVFLALRAQSQEMREPAGLIGALVCLALLFTPQTEFILHFYSFGGQIKALILVALGIIALRYPFESFQIQQASPATAGCVRA